MEVGVTFPLRPAFWPASVVSASLLLNPGSVKCVFVWILGESSQPVETDQKQATCLFVWILLATGRHRLTNQQKTIL